jgi:hypothetical protein
MFSLSLADLAEFLKTQNMPYAEDGEGNLVYKAEQTKSKHEIIFTNAKHGWLRALVKTPPIGVEKIRNPESLCREIGERFGSRVFLAFVNGGYTIFSFIRPDRLADEIGDFIYACDRLVPLFINLEKVDGVGVWTNRLITMAFAEVEGHA